MNAAPFISICIPAYKRIDFLQRLLDSIAIQTYGDYEVVITDDSPDDSVSLFVEKYADLKSVQYIRNKKSLGTPENWNEAIRNATGKWIKLMHDDDWFADKNALQLFYDEALKNKASSFIFCAYTNVNLAIKSNETVHLNRIAKFLLRKSPLNLFKKQFIGPPSCTLIRKDTDVFYDNKFKWVVDFEFYIRCLLKVKRFCYINQPLVNIGLNDDQVTKYSFRVPEVEIPENQMLVEKLGFQILRNIFVYDYYWRFYRNLGIRDQMDVKKYFDKDLHPWLLQMIRMQSKVSPSILRIGIFSKFLMCWSYLISFRKNI